MTEQKTKIKNVRNTCDVQKRRLRNELLENVVLTGKPK